MAGKAKLTAIDAFEDNLADAKTLLAVAKALDNQRIRSTAGGCFHCQETNSASPA